MALQIKDVLKRGDGVDVDDIPIDSSKHVATVTEGTLRYGARRWKQ